MKKVLAFVKTNLLSVIAVVIAVLALPALVFVSTGQQSKLQKDVQDDINGMDRTLQQVKFNYVFEPVTPDAERIEFSRTPNSATNAAMKSWGEQLRSQAERMLERIDTLEAILDAQTPDWRKRNGVE